MVVKTQNSNYMANHCRDKRCMQKFLDLNIRVQMNIWNLLHKDLIILKNCFKSFQNKRLSGF